MFPHFQLTFSGQELKELEAMLTEELSAADRGLVRRSIELIRRGDSAARIRRARVVGVGLGYLCI